MYKTTVGVTEHAFSPINMTRFKEIIAGLKKLSEIPSTKAVTMWIQPIDDGWSYEFNFSEEEMNAAHELCAELDSLLNFRVTFPTFAYRPKQ